MFMLVVYSSPLHINRAHPALESYGRVCSLYDLQNCVNVDGMLAAVLVMGEEGCKHADGF